MLNKINAYILLDKTRMRSYASQEKSANVKRKKSKYSLFPHKFNAEEYFIVNIDLCGADVRLGPLLMIIVIRWIYPLLMQCYIR